ncbi:DMT family transporter [Billgrantia saliphila]|uniref:DMT family transporter n=1 Tax=Billgrantia saliphila TaxID=1848458 RepID=UPI0018CC4B15|nr:DMT family transporter [Halomonas saliphila]
MEPAPKQDDNVLQGIMLILGAVFLLALADALVKYLSAKISLWQLYVLASLVSTPTLIGLITVRSDVRFGVESLSWVAVRSLLLLLMWIAYYAALPLIPLSVAAVAIYTTPLFIAILASMGTDEFLSRRGWVGITFGFLGVVMVLRPGGDAFATASLLPVMAALLYALAMVATRRHCQREHPLLLALGLNLAFLGAGSFFSAVLAVAETAHLAEHAPFLLSTWQPIGPQDFFIVAAYALLLVTVNTAVAKAYQVAPSALIGTYDYAYLIFACFWGYLLFNEVPDVMTWLGMSMIVSAGILILWQQLI